jgi:hypothetical protein
MGTMEGNPPRAIEIALREYAAHRHENEVAGARLGAWTVALRVAADSERIALTPAQRSFLAGFADKAAHHVERESFAGLLASSLLRSLSTVLGLK